MIICSCNVISDHEVRGLADRYSPRGSTAQVYRSLDRTPECGRCSASIRKIMDERLETVQR